MSGGAHRRPIEVLRDQLGAPPRTPRTDLERPPPPTWLHDSSADPLHALWEHHERLVRHGELVWSHLIMANGELWRPGDDDLPAGAVYSFDPIFDRHPEWLEPIATGLYRFHEGQVALDTDPCASVPLAPSVANLRHQLRTGYERPLAQPLPLELSGGRRVFHTTLMLHRAHLPGGYLVGSRLPLLVERRVGDGVAMVLPGELWPASWRPATG